MKINPDVIRNLQIDAGTARTEKAKDYYEKGKVKIVKATYENDKNFKAISVDGKPIIVCIADVCQVNEVNVHLSASWSSGASLVATYEGQTRYFFTNKATDTQKLTMEDCTKYGLACGSW